MGDGVAASRVPFVPRRQIDRTIFGAAACTPLKLQKFGEVAASRALS